MKLNGCESIITHPQCKDLLIYRLMHGNIKVILGRINRFTMMLNFIM